MCVCARDVCHSVCPRVLFVCGVSDLYLIVCVAFCYMSSL